MIKPLFRLIFGAFFLFVVSCNGDENNPLPDFTLSKRPVDHGLLFDYTNSFANIEESTQKYLRTLKNTYGIEACIVVLKEMPYNETIEGLAVNIFHNWDIGRETNGKGLLFLFIESDKQVRLEIAYELEDVFTDAFSGYIEDRQLRPNYRDENLEVGIVAVFEEVEKRAELKKFGEYTKDEIKEFDHRLLSGGGGVSKKISSYIEDQSGQQEDFTLPQIVSGEQAETVGKAWEIMLGKWAGKNSSTNIDIYTELTKLAMGDQNNPNDQRVTSQAKLLMGQPFFSIQNQDIAIIHFNKKKGWEYAPYLFTNDGSGWKFDIVSQRKFVVFGNKGSWRLERGDHQYNMIFDGFRSSSRKDIPFTEDVSYKIKDDRQIAGKIIELERKFDNNTEDFVVALELGRLGVVTARRPKHVYKPLNKAKEISPAAPEPHKYLAVYHVMSSFQYESALNEIQEYNKKVDSVFGINFQGFLHYKLQEYGKAVEYFKKSLGVQPSVYAYCKLSRAHAMLFLKSSQLDPRRSLHKQKAVDAYFSARNLSATSWRMPLLEKWLRYKGLLPEKP